VQFRSAGDRGAVPGVLNDGASGLRAIKRRGGLTAVQHPADATVPDMALSAIRYAEGDHVVPAVAMADLIARLARELAGPTPEIPFDVRLEAAIATEALPSMEADNKLGQLSSFTRPECQGALWEINAGSMLRYRCHVGHAFTAEAMLSSQSERTQGLSRSPLRRMAEQERKLNRDDLSEHCVNARDNEQDAEVIRGLLRSSEGGRMPEATEHGVQ
jgi:two-component system, chemotaxis family, protein-glutamate methylesterase/glutaminase